MALIKLTAENVFVGAVVRHKEKTLNIYKVNKTTFWAGFPETQKVLDAWKAKDKELTWLKLMEQIEAKKLEFDDALLDEASISKKNCFIKKARKTVGSFDVCCRAEFAKLYKLFLKDKSYRFPTACRCGKEFHAVKADKNENLLVISSDYSYYNYNTSTEEVVLFKTIGEKVEEVA
jgi:hypothetical protein